MKNITRSISKLPEYVHKAIKEKELPFLEQIRVKEYTNREAPLQGKRTAIIPWSGGLDSTTSLLMAIEAGLEITTVFFNYGQPYLEKEHTAVKALQEKISVTYPNAAWYTHYEIDGHLLDIQLKNLFSGEWGHIFPMRNYLILMEAATLAEPNLYTELWFSCVQGEMPYSGGDKSIVFLTYMKQLLAHRNICLTTPLVALTKSDMINWAMADSQRLSIIENTISCFNGEGGQHCGKCQACFNRAVAFHASHILERSGIDMESANFGSFADSYVKKLAQEEYYSPSRREQLHSFIKILQK